MDQYLLPLNESICAQIGYDVFDILTGLGVTHVLDVRSFIKGRGYSPTICTIFVIPGGGSYDFIDENGNVIDVLNGTLCSSSSLRYGELEEFSDLYQKILYI